MDDPTPEPKSLHTSLLPQQSEVSLLVDRSKHPNIRIGGELHFTRDGEHYALRKSVLRSYLQWLLESYHLSHFQIDLSFVSSLKITELCAQYLGKNQPTDVLAFPQTQFHTPIAKDSLPQHEAINHPPHLGDIVVCLSAVNMQNSIAQDILFIIAHGFLHLGGHDHIEGEECQFIMQNHERDLAKELAANQNLIIQNLLRTQST